MTEAAPALRDVWTCSSCRVSSRKPEVGPVPLPNRWELSADGPVCLACARKAAREAQRAGAAAEGGEGRESKLERARAASREALARKREALEARVRAALAAEDDPSGSEPPKRIASALGCGTARVREIRSEMARAGEIHMRRIGNGSPSASADTVAAIQGLGGEATVDAVAEAMGITITLARQRVTRLMKTGQVESRRNPADLRGLRLYSISRPTPASA